MDDFERAGLGYNGATVDFLIWLLDALNLESSLVASGMLGIINDDLSLPCGDVMGPSTVRLLSTPGFMAASTSNDPSSLKTRSRS